MLGGLITAALSGRAIFAINAGASVLIAGRIVWKLNKEWSEPVKERFDYRGSLLYMASIAMLMYGLSKLPDPTALGFTIAGMAGLVLFARVELKTRFPVLNMRLFTENRVFALGNLAALINYAATFSISFMLSLYLHYVNGNIDYLHFGGAYGAGHRLWAVLVAQHQCGHGLGRPEGVRHGIGAIGHHAQHGHDVEHGHCIADHSLVFGQGANRGIEFARVCEQHENCFWGVHSFVRGGGVCLAGEDEIRE
jgi:hypothetical protein